MDPEAAKSNGAVEPIEMVATGREDPPAPPASPEPSSRLEKIVAQLPCADVFSGCRQCCQAVGEACGELKTACMGIDCKGCMRQTCSVATLRKRLPIMQWLPKYK
jgi:hypothetical protein